MPKSANRFLRLPRIPAADPQESEQAWQNAPQLLAALNGARLGAWLWDIDSGRVSWSRGTQALFGFDPQRPLPADVDYLDLLPEEDRARTRQVFQAVFNGEPVEQAMRHRIRWPDGSLHWLEINGSLTHDQHGRPQMIGVIREITRQRERETALINSEKRFATLFHLSPNAILLTRRHDGMIFEVNQHFEDMFGWPGSQVIGKTSLELGLWVHPEQRHQVMESTRANGGPLIMEVQFRASSGKVHDGILCTQGIELEGITFLISTFVDTTERKARRAGLEGQPGTAGPGPGLGAAGHLGLAYPQRHALRFGRARAASRPAATLFTSRSMRFSRGCRNRSATRCARRTAACAKGPPATSRLPTGCSWRTAFRAISKAAHACTATNRATRCAWPAPCSTLPTRWSASSA
ncbi:hypothetical protein CHR26_00005 [Pseudomonas putida]|nr:hypothetical protein CHR26_00005 [Pseudomonas putida]